MKKLIFLLLNLLIALPLMGQTVGANQIKKKTNAGLVADSSNALAVGVYRGTSAPASPVTGQIWADTTTTPATIKTYNGSTWEISPTSAVTIQPDLSTLPANPTSGQIVWASNFKRAIVYDSATSAWYYLDGSRRQVFPTYSTEGLYSSTFLTAPTQTTGSATNGGSVTAGAHKCVTTFYNSTGGETLPGPDTGTITAGSTNLTLSLTIPTGDANTVGRRIYCTKAGQASPYFLIDSVANNTTTSFAVTIADASYGVSTAPDTNFSAPLPSGWAVSTIGLSYGGCGSTGVSLMCSLIKNLGTANASSYIGIRLYYTLSYPDYVVTYRFKRASPGFTGGLGDNDYYIAMAYAGSDPASASGGYSRAIGLYNNSSNTLLPPGTNSGVWWSFYRDKASAWAANTGGDVDDGFRFPVSVPALFRISGQSYNGSYYGRIDLSTNALLSHWNDGWSYGPYDASLDKVGIAIETSRASATAVFNTAVYEIDQFTAVYY